MDYKRLIVESGIKMLAENYTVEAWGNISCRDPETGRVYLTPSGMNYTTLTESDVVVMDIDGNTLEGERCPTIEYGLHLGVYRARPEVNAVLHTHPLYSTVFACMGEDIPLFTDEAAQTLGDVCRVAQYALPGSIELADNCVAALGDKAKSCLLQSHGAVCVGNDMSSAFRVVKVLEMTAHIYQLIRATGGQYIPISSQNIAAMQDFMAHHYGQSNK